jgi:hypothetical protein
MIKEPPVLNKTKIRSINLIAILLRIYITGYPAKSNLVDNNTKYKFFLKKTDYGVFFVERR